MLKKIIFSVILGIILFATFEIFALLGLQYLETKGLRYSPLMADALTDAQRVKVMDIISGRTKYVELDAELGWALKKDAQAGNYATNSGGFRGSINYEPSPPPGKIRIASFGDSFVHGDDVGNDDTWQSQLEALDPRLEVLNFGVGGYGTDQSYLRYLKLGRSYHPHIVIIGLVSENIQRNVNAFRPFFVPGTELPMTKPFFVLDAGQLKLVRNSLATVEDYRHLYDNEAEVIQRLLKNEPKLENYYVAGEFDSLALVRLFKVLNNAYKIHRTDHQSVVRDYTYNPRSDAFKITLKIIEMFYDEALKNDAVPVIVIFPTKYDMERKQHHLHSSYHFIKEAFGAQKYRHVDLLDSVPEGLTREEIRTYFGPTLHYAPKGNAFAAREIRAYLERNGLLGGN